MKLLRISIHGFKSFADKISIDIKDGITGIVGPNGSGKSNIVDAVKWVLGEQSLKDIRGGSISSDIIFNGSKSRNALTRGWVSLTFDNSDHYLKSDLTEIEIKRVVYRTGENEYYINNESVRLKDITDLFIDSGSSVNSLSIISQGKIGEIINGTSTDKKAIIEEAAGVLKYKKRKEDTLKKLDKANDNLERIGLIIDELSVNLEPLKVEAETATKFKNYKNELENTEIALLAIDIKSLNEEYHKHQEEKDKLNSKILSFDNSNVLFSSKIDNLKLKLIKIEDQISSKSDELYKTTNLLSSLASEKQVMVEREKYKVDDSKLKMNVLNLKEDELKLKNAIKTLKEEISTKETELTKENSKAVKINSEYQTTLFSKESLNKELTNLIKEEEFLKNKIDIIKDNIESDNKLPFAVKSILSNHRLNGIHDALGKLIETEEKYSTAIDIALGYTSNVIIVDNEYSAKDAINYLKQNGLGRATFYPLNVIKPKGVDDNTLKKLASEPSFIGTASSLVKFNPTYRNIILNTLGNTIIIDNLTNANKISNVINHLYRIVTLDGDLIATGGSITGGSTKSSTGLLKQKFDLEEQIKLLNEKNNVIKLKEEAINNIDNDLKILENKVFEQTNLINSLKEYLLRKYNELSNLESSLTSIQNEIKGTNGLINNNIDNEVEACLKKYYEVKENKDSLELLLNGYKNVKNDLQSEINELELNNKKTNLEYNKLNKDLSNLEVNLTKEEMKLDSLLLRLNEEYSITYEKALTYELSEDLETSRSKVNTLKHDMKLLGDVNLGSINEYERINTRYTFLTKQKEDLTASINDLLVIINELDDTMKDKLNKTFNELNKEFGKVFKNLFKGGEASLILTDPNDILASGMEIKAIPPGKEIKNIKLLSGGEGALTAIALLFAILNIRTVPFCILDEVEAPLDEANVDMFGNYLKQINTKTQFIIITHKKRTMEYADNLYGITMQESGVSKLVSVKLD
jgi:chromosome segregation protein